jgi:uncharacterized Fe-S radical SAM superfamily protein PflX
MCPDRPETAQSLTTWLDRWAGEVRFFPTETGLEVDRLYPSVMAHLPAQDDRWAQAQALWQAAEALPGRELPQSNGRGFPIYSAGLHFGEEPQLPQPLGAVFFRGCGVGCNFCSDWDQVFSRGPLTPGRDLLELIDALKTAGAAGLDLVNPDLWVDSLAPLLTAARELGLLPQPVVWNTHGYHLDWEATRGFVDLYLFDVKFTNTLGGRLTRVDDYLTRCLESLDKALSLVGLPTSTPWQHGVMIRYLVMPDQNADAAEVFRAIAAVEPQLPVHLMDQYLPLRGDLPARRVTASELAECRQLALDAGLQRVW